MVQDLEDAHARHYLRELDSRLSAQLHKRLIGIAAVGGILVIVAMFPILYVVTGKVPQPGMIPTVAGMIVTAGVLLGVLESRFGKRRRFPYLDDYE